MLNQVLNLTSQFFFNHEQVGDQADGKLLLLHVMSFRAALFLIDCVLGRGIKNRSHGLYGTRITHKLYTYVVSMEALGCAMFSAKRFGLRHVDTKRFGACAG